MNKVFLIGNVGGEPDVHTFEDGGAVANFSLATTERGYKLQNGTEVPDRTDWHRIVLKGNLAKVAQNYVHKGDKVCIVGKVMYRDYEDRNGQKVHMTEVIGNDMELLSPKKDGAQPQTQTAAPTPQPVQQPQPQPQVQQAAPLFPTAGSDDLPF